MLDLLLGRLLVIVLIALPLGMARECHDVWADWRAGCRSLPMALAFTSIAIQLPLVLVGMPMLEKFAHADVAATVQAIFVPVFLVTAMLGVAGLILDRRIKRQDSQTIEGTKDG